MTKTLAPLLRIALGVLACAAVAPVVSSPSPPAEWQFTVRLDGQPIGTHRFVLARADEGGTLMRSEARFDVKLLGLSLYRYRHESTERWSDGCLASIDARTVVPQQPVNLAPPDLQVEILHHQAVAEFLVKIFDLDHARLPDAILSSRWFPAPPKGS